MIQQSPEVLARFPELRHDEMVVEYEDGDDPILLRPDGTAVDTWRENYPSPARAGTRRARAARSSASPST